MINLSQKNVVKIAKETNFIKDNVEKVMRLADILEFVFTSKWKDKLALKGGTAINLFYRELPRLSVDIDLFSTKKLLINCRQTGVGLDLILLPILAWGKPFYQNN